ncbi:MAG: DUF1376 domain-containing protein [Beijerinckiaceae bacterium]|nr:DUF1376 domain-containing protein [Beijerinckiaceae bacterium]
MSNNLYMPFHVGDYMGDTAFLTTAEQHGAYMLLLMNYWHSGKPLPVEDWKLAAIAKVSPESWSAMRDIIRAFFRERDGALHHKRVDEELAKAREKSDRARANAGLSHSARKAKAKRPQSERRAGAERTQSECLANQDQDQEQEEESANAASSGAAAVAKPNFEGECRTLVGEEPVLLAQDFHKLRSLVDSGSVTEADVKAGIVAAMAKPDFRIRHWSQLEGWARGAAKERLAARAKVAGAAPAAAPKRTAADNTPDQWRKNLEHFCSGGAWPGQNISPEPGQRGCLVPREILEEFRPRLRKVISPGSFARIFEPELAGAAE